MSRASQHRAGMQTSQTILLAINKDEMRRDLRDRGLRRGGRPDSGAAAAIEALRERKG
ncbi:hypothetical protein QJS66_13530 [Kocuria rhizophila]|nr:hypothetical protein QJS66_13530 [Kocuria rhizophila]